MAWCSELLAFSSSSLSDDHGSPEPVGTSRSRWLRGPMLADRRAGGAGPQRRVYTAVRAGSGANRTTRAAGTQTTRQPCARGSRSDGWPSSTALLCRVQASTRDPAARAALWLFDARPAAAQDSEEEARTASTTRKTTTTGTGAGRSARAALRVPPPANGTATHSRAGGPLLRGQRRGAAR